MDRRRFLSTAAAGAILPAAAALPGGAAIAAGRKRPNVLYVFDDQHRYSALPGEEYSPVIAPNLDAFRRANFSMDRCVSNYPLCTPYRGILMTGRWPYQTGITHNGAPYPVTEISLGRVFRDQGYNTAYVGKWHLQGPGVGFVPPGPNRHGFDDWHVWERTNNHYSSWTYDPDTGEKITSTTWNCTAMTDQAIAVLKKQTPDKPFFLVVSWNPPHPPYNPPEEDQAPYSAEMLHKDRPNLRIPNPQGPPPLHDEAAYRKVERGYYGAITGVDKEFARLMATLEETGHADDTIVIFTADHGEMLGSHGRMAKSVPFEESCRVPFFVRYPGVTKAQGKSETLFQAIDIFPTVCGLAGLPVPRTCAGRDMSPVMKGGSPPRAISGVFLMNQVAGDGSDNDEGPAGAGDAGGMGKRGRKKARKARGGSADFVSLPNNRGIRTDTHTYAVVEDGRWFLYDNVADPYQTKNLVDDPAQQGLIRKLDAEIMAWMKETGDPFPYAQAIKRTSSYPT